MSQWFEPPGGIAQEVKADDIVLISQNGVSRATTVGALISSMGVLSGADVGADGTYTDRGGSGKKCKIGLLFTGVDDQGKDMWVFDPYTV